MQVNNVNRLNSNDFNENEVIAIQSAFFWKNGLGVALSSVTITPLTILKLSASMNSSQLTPALSSAVLPTFPASYQRNTQRISLPYLNRTVLVSVDDIVSLEGEGNYTFVCTRDRKKYLVAKTLKGFEGMMNAEQFIRIHKSHMVNLAYVQAATFNKERSLRMADGRHIMISRRRQKEIMHHLNTYLQRLVN